MRSWVAPEHRPELGPGIGSDHDSIGTPAAAAPYPAASRINVGHIRALSATLLTFLILAACGQPAPPPAATSGPQPSVSPIVEVTINPAQVPQGVRSFDPTAAVGGGSNASGAVPPEDIASAFSQVASANGFKIAANASPPNARGADVTSISIKADDTGTVLASLDQPGRKALGESLLTAAATVWPNARISLIVSNPTQPTAGQIVGTRLPTSNTTTVFAT